MTSKEHKNIERKKANLLRIIKYHDGEGYKDIFKIKKVHVSPESLTALYERINMIMLMILNRLLLLICLELR
ncbi:MAG: plasmid segregation protein ParM domain-containing protein [Arsenophonus sp. NC-PG7-MAG3]